MIMQPNTIKPAKGSKRKSKRVGRGNASGKGNYSARGLKGQRSRSGGKGGLKLKGVKHIIQSTPKLRGFKSLATKPATITLQNIEKKFENGEVVSMVTLREKKLINKNIKSAKIVSTGELTKKIILEGVGFTKVAEEKIKAVGGEIK